MQCGLSPRCIKKQKKEKHSVHRCKERCATETVNMVSTGFEFSTVHIKYG